MDTTTTTCTWDNECEQVAVRWGIPMFDGSTNAIKVCAEHARQMAALNIAAQREL